jgi:hypothetical protein
MPDVDQHAGAVGPAGEEVRGMAPGLAGLADPVQPHRLGRDRLHTRIGIKRHQHVALDPRLIADVLDDPRDPPPARPVPLPPE